MLGLILRLFDPVSGKVLIGGVDAREAAIADLRGVMGLVPQETALFTGTIADNIRFDRPDADFASLREAAVNANADGFIMDMPQGYDTPIGEECGFPAVSVSALPARALLRDPAILLLDEATSSLDAQSEQAVQLARLMQGRTTVVIAHRLATVLNADRIVVMNEGQIEDIGSHEDLLTRCRFIMIWLHSSWLPVVTPLPFRNRPSAIDASKSMMACLFSRSTSCSRSVASGSY